VIVDGESGRLRLGGASKSLRAESVELATRLGPVIARDLALAPAEVIDWSDVREEVESFLVAQIRAGLDEPGRIDDERRLAVRVLALDQARNSFEGQLATPRISYAGGTPALIFSWRRTMPSINASGRGGHPGTWMSTATILSTPCRIA
jgi:hypothetical protein